MPAIVRNAGTDSDESSQSMRDALLIIIAPTMINAGAVIGKVIPDHADQRAEEQRDEKQRAATTAVRPVRPPADTPAALSI